MQRTLLTLAIVLLSIGTLVLAQENAQTRIPDSLLDCYKNNSLYHRESRPTMTLATLIELIRKVEKYPGLNMDMRALTISILHRFRLDGIEMNNEVTSSEGVVPFSVKGYQFFKHRILLRSFMQGSAVQFPNASLNAIEQCAMHFLISNSIDKGQRGDEGSVCNKISNYRERSRAPRSLADDDVDPLTLSVAMPPDDAVDVPNTSNPDADVEVLNPQSLVNLHKENMFLDNDDNADGTFSRPSPKPKVKTGLRQSVNPPVQPGARATQVESECPVENGVISTPFGAVSAGTLLAGIAAGLQPGDVNAKMLNPKATENIIVQNIYAATLAGDLAEVTLQQGPRYGENLVVGMSGGWNSTFIPRWYFNPNHNGKKQDQLTDAEIRGGLDGLIIAKNIQEWNRQAGSRLRLSQVLDMYYSNRGVFGDIRYRACARKEMYSEVAPNTELQLQTEGFSLILDPQMINEAYLDETNIKKYSSTAVSKLNNYIPSTLPSIACTTRAEALTGKMYPAIDLYVVLDTAWSFQDMNPLLFGIISKLELGTYNSNITIISGKEKKFMLNSTNSITDFSSNFTEKLYNSGNFAYGMDMPGALEKDLKELFEHQLGVDKDTNNVGGVPRVVLFIPGINHGLGDNDQEVIQRSKQYFRDKIPDTKFLVMARTNKDTYRYVLDDPTKDFFTLNMGSDAGSIDSSVDPFIARTREIHRVISNPTCGNVWRTVDYSSLSLTEYLVPKTVNYYKLHPNYFFISGYSKLRVQGYGYGDVKVCHSRGSEFPNNSTTSNSDVTCRQIKSDTIDIELNKPCDGYTFVSQCPPLYISVEDMGTGNTYQCFDNECRYPDSIKYQISHEKLTCTGGIGHFLGSPALITFTTLLIATIKNIYSSH